MQSYECERSEITGCQDCFLQLWGPIIKLYKCAVSTVAIKTRFKSIKRYFLYKRCYPVYYTLCAVTRCVLSHDCRAFTLKLVLLLKKFLERKKRKIKTLTSMENMITTLSSETKIMKYVLQQYTQ